MSDVRFRVSNKARPDVPSLVVAAERWWDVRAIALMEFGCEPDDLAYERAAASSVVHVETRWTGVDGQSPMGRRMQFRLASEIEWNDVSEYVPAANRRVA